MKNALYNFIHEQCNCTVSTSRPLSLTCIGLITIKPSSHFTSSPFQFLVDALDDISTSIYTFSILFINFNNCLWVIVWIATHLSSFERLQKRHTWAKPCNKALVLMIQVYTLAYSAEILEKEIMLKKLFVTSLLKLTREKLFILRFWVTRLCQFSCTSTYCMFSQRCSKI